MTLEELKQAAAESSTKDAIVAAIVESEEFNETDIKNYLEILGKDGEVELKDVFEEIARNEFENNPDEEKTIELFIRAGYDLKAIFEFVWDRAIGYRQAREADVFCATLAEAYIGGSCGLPKDYQKALEVFRFVAELSSAWSGEWVGALSVSLDRLLLNYIKGTFDDSVIKSIVSNIQTTHFAESVTGCEASSIYILHQFMVGNANQILNRADFNRYVERFIQG